MVIKIYIRLLLFDEKINKYKRAFKMPHKICIDYVKSQKTAGEFRKTLYKLQVSYERRNSDDNPLF